MTSFNYNCESISKLDLLGIIDSEIDARTLVGHHIDSFNSFTSQGIKQIITQLFKIEFTMNNERTNTPEDNEIETIHVEGVFTNVFMGRPTSRNYYTGAVTDLKPNQARKSRLNYSSPLFVDIKLTAKAFLKTGGDPKIITGEVKNHKVANIPAMIGSNLCHTHEMSKMTKKNIEEDPRDKGGYFILKGGEWCINMLETRLFNSPNIFRNVGHKSEITRLEFLSKPGDAFENSSSLMIKYVKNCNIYFNLDSLDYFKLNIPFYIIFRLLGMTSDQEICDNIIYGYSSDSVDVVSDHMFSVISRALTVSDPVFGKAYLISNQSELLELLVRQVSIYYSENYSRNAGASSNQEDKTYQYLKANILKLFDKWLFPHIGTSPESRHLKLRFFGHLIHKMLLVEFQIVESTDRDSLKNKRINAAGQSFAKSFKRDFNSTVVFPAKKKLRRDFQTMPFSQVNLAQSFISAIDAPSLEKALIQAISTGNKEINVRQRKHKNYMASEMLHRKNDLNVLSTLRVIRTANTSSSEQDARSDRIRRFHPSYTGYICPNQSADTGKQVGMVKQMAIGAFVSEASSSELLKDKLREDRDFIILKNIFTHDIYEHKLTKILVNGDWIGCVKNAPKFWYRFRDLRRGISWNDFSDSKTVKITPRIDPTTSIHWDTDVNEIQFWVDAGRMMRPLLVVRNNGELDPVGREYFASAFNPKKNTGFMQDIILTHEQTRALLKKEITSQDLLNGVIDYVSPEEMENYLIAFDINELKRNKNNALKQYTHCDIPESLIGLVALTSPYANFNQLPRVTFQTNQGKQTFGWYAMNWPYRIDKHAFMQFYAELPVVSTLASKYTDSNGTNMIVAIMSYGGYNQEDSLFYNIASAQRGLVKGVAFSFVHSELDKNEYFGNPDVINTTDIKRYANYDKISNGFPARGTKIKTNDIIIGKYTDSQNDKSSFRDVSVVYTSNETCTVDAVIKSRDQEAVKFARVKCSAVRELNIGDKFSSRHGQKGMTGVGYNHSDMPFTKSGIIPDLVLNPHAIPSRMTIGQMLEGYTGKLAIIRGILTDATVFCEMDTEEIGDQLEARGWDRYSNERMWCGTSGEWIDTEIFISTTFYQRLQKFAIEEVYSISTGPTCIMTRQPLEGKANRGGLRIGEMEKDVIITHGAGHFIMEKFRDDSDGFDIYVCRTCGNRPVVNEQKNLVICNRCQAANLDPQVYKVRSTWTSKLFFDELESSGIGVKLNIEPFTYEF